MKKYLLSCLLIFALPCTAMAEEAQSQENETTQIEAEENVIVPDEYMYPELYINPTNEQLFIEYNIALYSNAEVEITDMDDIDITQLNSDGRMSLSVGIETESVRFAVSPSFQTEENVELGSIDLSLDFMPKRDRISPFLGIHVGFNWIDVEDYDISETAMGYGMHAGILYDIADNLFFKLALGFSVVEFELDDYDDTNIEISGFNITTGFGFRF